MTSGMMTVFTCPKGFVGHNGLIQRNAFANWRALGLEVIVFGDDPGVREACEEYGFLHIPDVECNSYGTPLLSDIFARAQELAQTPYVLFSNADIIFPPALNELLPIVRKRFKDFLVIGRRWDIAIEEELSFEGDWWSVLERNVAKTAVQHAPSGKDYFLFPKGMITMPAFAIGRPGWDDWTVADAVTKGKTVIDATRFLSIVHQNHDYAHVSDCPQGNYRKSPEGLENRRLMLSLLWGVNIRRKSVTHSAQWMLTKQGRIRWHISKEKFLWGASCLRLDFYLLRLRLLKKLGLLQH